VSRSPLRELLEKEAGWEEFQMVVPHPFLPPRFRKLAEGRNMIILLDRDMTLHVRWEGARVHEHHPLTPRATQGLIREILRYMTKYRRELQVFSGFVGSCAEQPFDDPRALDPVRFKDKPLPAAPKEKEKKAEENLPIEITATVSLPMYEMGGESPMPMMEEFDGG